MVVSLVMIKDAAVELKNVLLEQIGRIGFRTLFLMLGAVTTAYPVDLTNG